MAASDFAGNELLPGQHRNHQENVAFDIDMWYPLLKTLTMETRFLPLSMEERFAIVPYYRMRFMQAEAFRAFLSSADRLVLE
jgi:hypothetical protein